MESLQKPLGTLIVFKSVDTSDTLGHKSEITPVEIKTKKYRQRSPFVCIFKVKEKLLRYYSGLLCNQHLYICPPGGAEDGPRVIFSVDLWHPNVAAAERQALDYIFAPEQ